MPKFGRSYDYNVTEAFFMTGNIRKSILQKGTPPRMLLDTASTKDNLRRHAGFGSEVCRHGEAGFRDSFGGGGYLKITSIHKAERTFEALAEETFRRQIPPCQGCL